jgi:hypothetical protein
MADAKAKPWRNGTNTNSKFGRDFPATNDDLHSINRPSRWNSWCAECASGFRLSGSSKTERNIARLIDRLPPLHDGGVTHRVPQHRRSLRFPPGPGAHKMGDAPHPTQPQALAPPTLPRSPEWAKHEGPPAPRGRRAWEQDPPNSSRRPHSPSKQPEDANLSSRLKGACTIGIMSHVLTC